MSFHYHHYLSHHAQYFSSSSHINHHILIVPSPHVFPLSFHTYHPIILSSFLHQVTLPIISNHTSHSITSFSALSRHSPTLSCHPFLPSSHFLLCIDISSNTYRTPPLLYVHKVLVAATRVSKCVCTVLVTDKQDFFIVK